MATGTVTTVANSMIGGTAYQTSNGNQYSSQSAAQTAQNAINSASSAPAASTTTKATTPATTTAPAASSTGQSSAKPYGASDGTYYATQAEATARNAQIAAAHAASTGASAAAPVTTGNPSVNTYASNVAASTTPSTTTGALSDTSLTGLASSLLSGIQSLMGSIQTSTPSASQIQTLGNQYAESQVDPQLTELASELATAQTTEQSGVNQVNAAYSQLPAEATTMLSNVRQQAMNDAIARGAGTSGVYDYDYEKLAEPVTEQVNTSEAQQAASINDLMSQLGTTTSNIANQQTALGAQEGNLSANYQQQLQEYYSAAQSGDLSSLLSAATNLASLGEQTTSSNENLALNTLVAYMNATGKVPTSTTLTDILNGTYTNTASAPAAGSSTSTAAAPAAAGSTANVGAQSTGALAAGTPSTAYDPTTGQVVSVTVDSAGRTTTQLNIGSIVSIGGNYYKITDGTPGAYTSVQVSTPKG